MEQRILTRCYRAAVYTATASIENLAREAGYARPTVEMYLYQRPPSADAARALAAALERRAARLSKLAAQLRAAAGKAPRRPVRRRARRKLQHLGRSS
jgi:DNA transposition AAA+ family ATPase